MYILMFSGIHENNDRRDQPYLCIMTIKSVKELHSSCLFFFKKENKCDSAMFSSY